MLKQKQILLAWKFALIELRAGLTGFRIFLACLVLGVGTIAGLGSLITSIQAGIDRDGKKLLGGDVSLRLLHRPATEAQRMFLSSTSKFSEIVEMRAMAVKLAKSGQSTLVEIKAVDLNYPLLGKVKLREKMSLTEALQFTDGLWGAIADQSLLDKLNIGVGDKFRLGSGFFRLMGTIKDEPDRIANVMTLGPRLMVRTASLASTKLIQPGSQIRYRYRVLLRKGLASDAWSKTLLEKFPKAGWRIRYVNNAAPSLQRFIERLALFLSFVGLTTLLIGGIGVSNAVSSYLDKKKKIIATFKSLGASNYFIFCTYFIQVSILSTFGIILGLITGALLPIFLIYSLRNILPVTPEIGLYALPLLIAAAFGVLITMTFTLWPLAKAQATPVAHLFRDKVSVTNVVPNYKFIILVIVCAVILAGLIILTAEEEWFASWFVLGSLVALSVLRGASSAVVWLAKQCVNLSALELRLALSNLFRPGAITHSVVISLGLGLTVLIAIGLIEGNLTRQINDRLPNMAPSLFFIDIQKEQVAGFDRTIKSFPKIGQLQRRATLRGRIIRINGIPVERAKIKPNVQWAVQGDRALTYSAKPDKGSKIVAGKWWPKDYNGPPLISLDAAIAEGFNVGIGSTLTFNILGREIDATISSLRKINWQSLRFDFAVIFSPGTLDTAPQSHIAALYAPIEIENTIEKAVNQNFANVSTIRVREILKAVAKMLEGIGGAIKLTSIITIIGGSLVLSGAVAAGIRRRIYEAVIFKVLGATRTIILRVLLIEYTVLAFVTAAIASIIATLIAWGVIVFVMNMNWFFIPSIILKTTSGCILVIILIGLSGTWHTLGQKPAPLLRNE